MQIFIATLSLIALLGIVFIIYSFTAMYKYQKQEHARWKNQYLCYLSKYRKELKNCKDLRRAKIGLEAYITDLEDRLPSYNNPLQELPYHTEKLKILDLKYDVMIDQGSIVQLHYMKEQDYLNRIRFDIAKRIGMELFEKKLIEFTERTDRDFLYDEFLMYPSCNKIITGKIKLAVKQD